MSKSNPLHWPTSPEPDFEPDDEPINEPQPWPMPGVPLPQPRQPGELPF